MPLPIVAGAGALSKILPWLIGAGYYGWQTGQPSWRRLTGRETPTEFQRRFGFTQMTPYAQREYKSSFYGEPSEAAQVFKKKPQEIIEARRVAKLAEAGGGKIPTKPPTKPPEEPPETPSKVTGIYETLQEARDAVNQLNLSPGDYKITWDGVQYVVELSPKVKEKEEGIRPESEAEKNRLIWEKEQYGKEQTWRETQAKEEQAWRQEQLMWQRQQLLQQKEEQERQYKSQLLANPMSWLQYNAYVGTTPAIQPWMLPLMSGQYQAGQTLPGWQGGQGGIGGEGQPVGSLPELRTPSSQLWARMGPTAQSQYLGYQQTRTAARPEETQFRLRAGAPPSGRYAGMRWLR